MKKFSRYWKISSTENMIPDRRDQPYFALIQSMGVSFMPQDRKRDLKLSTATLLNGGNRQLEFVKLSIREEGAAQKALKMCKEVQ